MIEDAHFKVIEGKTKPQILENDLVHRETILLEFQAYPGHRRQSQDPEVPTKSLLTPAILNNGVRFPSSVI